MLAQTRFGRAALRAAIIGLATAALAPALATAASAADTGARDIDWKNASLKITQQDERCPAGPIEFAAGVAEIDAGGRFPSFYHQGDVKYGDVDRDGREDAVLSITCNPNGSSTAALTGVYAYRVDAGAPVLIGAVTTSPITPESYSVRHGAVQVTARPDRDADSTPVNFTLRWDGTSFTERTGRSAYLFDWGNATLAMPFKADAVPMRNGWGGAEPRPCPKTTVTFDNINDGYGRQGEFTTADNFTYSISVDEFGDVNKDGVTDALVTVGCNDQNVFYPNTWAYVYTVKNGKPVVLSYLTANDAAAGYTAISNVTMSRGKVALTQYAGTSDVAVDRTFNWTKAGLKADKPLPGFPNVDVAP